MHSFFQLRPPFFFPQTPLSQYGNHSNDDDQSNDDEMSIVKLPSSYHVLMWFFLSHHHNISLAACLDDLRVSDHQLPLPPAVNGTTWGQVTTMEHFIEGCHPPGDPCANISCAAPRSCRAAWDQPSCSYDVPSVNQGKENREVGSRGSEGEPEYVSTTQVDDDVSGNLESRF
ncbi:Neural-cadherin [Portunus trituberculatus]|uniref:Neural-cadherin n=1 Tax=Portunus trituberculatus TaxID=210409 RepID=A0A5B7JTK2_PORTR|nr:Neural-cadherin [Portunus trituberculatus]